MALPTNFSPGDAGHVEAHEATNMEVNRVATIADGLPANLAEYIRDTISETLVQGANVTITKDDTGNTVTIASTGGSGGGGGDIDASQIVSGTVPVDRLGASGTRDATTYLRGDNAWATPPSGGGAGFGGIVPRSGEYVGNGAYGRGSGSFNEMAAHAAMIPIWVPATFSNVRFDVYTASSTGTTARIHIYDGAGALLGSTGSIPLTGDGPRNVAFLAPVSAPAGIVQVAIVMSQADAALRLSDAASSSRLVATGIAFENLEYEYASGLRYALTAYSTDAPDLAALQRTAAGRSPIFRLKVA